MGKFQGVDFYDVDSLLSEEERAVRDTVRAWVDDNLMPVIGEHYLEGRFPKQLVPQMAELGLFGANLPEEYGCAGLNNVAYGLIMQELERGDSGVRSFASVQGALAMYPIYAFGSDEQKRRWLPKMASGEVIGCFGLTEPDYGSNPGDGRAQGPASVPHAGAQWHCVGSGGRGNGVLRRGGELRQDAGDVRQADRRLPAAAGTAGRDAHRDHQGTAPQPAARAAQGRGEGHAATGVARQAEQREHRDRRGA